MPLPVLTPEDQQKASRFGRLVPPWVPWVALWVGVWGGFLKGLGSAVAFRAGVGGSLLRLGAPRFVLAPLRLRSGVLGLMQAIDLLEQDLSYVLESKKLPEEIMAHFVALDITEMSTFTHIADAAPDLRVWAKSAFFLDPTAAAKDSTNLAKILAAWEACKKRIKKQDDQESDQRAAGLPASSMKGKHVEMRQTYSTLHNNKVILPKSETPSSNYVDLMLDQLEDGEFMAESLREVTSLDEVLDVQEPSELGWAPGGGFKLKRTKKEVPLPNTTEELRHRHRLMSVKLLMMKTKYPSRRVFKDITKDTIPSLTDHILGEKVKGLTFKDASGAVVGSAQWTQCIEFEHQLRLHAIDLVNLEGKSFGEAFKMAMANKDLREQHFSTPSSVNAAVAAAQAAVAGDRSRGQGLSLPAPPAAIMPWSAPAQQQQSPNPLSENTFKKGFNWWSDTQGRVCTLFQRSRCGGGCGHAHICAYCHQQHGADACPQKPAGITPPQSTWSPQPDDKGKAKGKGKDKGQSKGKGKGKKVQSKKKWPSQWGQGKGSW